MIHDLDRGTSFQLTFDGRQNRFPRWMPDGRLAYASVRDGREGIWAQPFDRSGTEAVLFETEHQIRGFDVSPRAGDPMAVVLSPRSELSPDEQGIYLVDAEGGAPRPFVAGRFEEGAPAISPDGNWLAYDSNETGETRVYAQAFPAGGRPWPVGSGIAMAPAWAAGATELFTVVREGLIRARLQLGEEVRVTALEEFLVVGGGAPFDAPWRALSGAQPRGAGGAAYDISEDGDVLTIVSAATSEAADADPGLPVVVLNVFEEIRQRLGGG